MVCCCGAAVVVSPECRIIVQFVLEIMTRKFVLTGAAVTILVTLTNVILAGANDYVFEGPGSPSHNRRLVTAARHLAALASHQAGKGLDALPAHREKDVRLPVDA